MAALVRRLHNGLLDAVRTGWALGYWNLRKTLWVLGGRKGRAPCQDRYDDDVAGYIRCHAILDWAEPARFQRVCPLLQQGPDGWRCSVASRAVRPFWGRAVAWIGGGLLTLYLAGALLVWQLLVFAGTPELRFRQVVWPAAWSEIREQQAQSFFRQSIDAFRRGRLVEAVLALQSARMRNPHHYDAALLMAQVTQFQGNHADADELFQALLSNFPVQRQRTAVTYHDTLLAIDRMPALASLSLAMARREHGHTALWVRSLLLAVRRGELAPNFIEENAAAIGQLAPYARLLLQAEAELGRYGREKALAALRQPFEGPLNVTYMQAQIGRLLQLGDPEGAERLLRYYGHALGNFEAQAQQYLIECVQGDVWSARATLHGLMRAELEPGIVERLQTLLLRYPDRELYLQLQQRVLQRPGLAQKVNGPAMWVTALVCDAAEEGRVWQNLGVQHFGDHYPPVTHVDFTRRRIDEPNSVIHLINVLTFPREVIYTLLAKVQPEAVRLPADAKRALRQREG